MTPPVPAPAGLEEAAAAVRARLGLAGRAGDVGVILGSGLGGYAEGLTSAAGVPFAEIPHMERSGVPGHRGLLVRGIRAGRALLCLVGRLHYYEGLTLQQVTFPVHLLAALGARALVVTNASGGIDPALRPGDFVLVMDHINLMGASPLRGGPTFADMSAVYDAQAGARVRDAAARADIRLHPGVLAAVAGPQYETPAEVRMLRTLGADAVCMSSVPEAIVARALGLRVLGLSLVTNAAGGRGGAVAHEGVLAAAAAGAARFAQLLDAAVEALA